jgi:hypothetical protein
MGIPYQCTNCNVLPCECASLIWGYWWRNLRRGENGRLVGASDGLTRRYAVDSRKRCVKQFGMMNGYEFGPVQRIGDPRHQFDKPETKQSVVCEQHPGKPNLEAIEAIYERVTPRWHKRASDALAGTLLPEHKTHAEPGSNRGGQFTPRKRTWEALAKYVLENPGCKLPEAVEAIGNTVHHTVCLARGLARSNERHVNQETETQ